MLHLFTHELLHITVSLMVFWWFRNRVRWQTSLVLSLLIGVFVDVDHMYDYVLYLLHYHQMFSLSDFLYSNYFSWSGTFYVPLHAWEWVFLLWIVYGYLHIYGRTIPILLHNSVTKILLKKIVIWLPVIASVLAGHLVVDQLTNNVTPFTYFFFFRLAKGFNVEEVF